MAFPANPYADMSQFVPAGPNGIPIPRSLAPTFGIVEPPAPVVPPEPIVVPPPPAPAPAPSPAPNAAAMFQQGSEQFAAPPLNDNTIDPFPAPATAPAPAPKAAPRAAPATATGMQLDSLDQRAEVARQAGDVKAAAADAESVIRDKQLIDEDLAEKKRDAARQQEQKEIAAARAGQQAAFDKYVNHKVDQNRAWHNKSTGSKIMAGIGVAMAGIGQAFSARAGRDVGQSNPALDLITKAIDDDVRLQMAERDQLRDVAGMKKDAANELVAQFKDRESQYDALRAAGRDRVRMQIEAAASKAQAPLAKLAAQDLAAQLDGQRGEILGVAQQREEESRARRAQLGLAYKADKRADAAAERDIFESDRTFVEDKRRFDAGQTAAAAKVDPAIAKEQREQERENKKLVIPGLARKDGAPLLARTEEEAKKLRSQKQAADKMLTLLDESMRLMDKHGGESASLKGEIWQKLKSNEAAIMNTLRSLEGMGTLDASAIEIAKQQAGGADPTSFVHNARPGYGNLRRQVLGAVNAAALSQDEEAGIYDVPEATEAGVLGGATESPAYKAAFARDRAGGTLDLNRTVDQVRAATGDAKGTEKLRIETGLGKAAQAAIEAQISLLSDPWASAAAKEQAGKFIRGWTMTKNDNAAVRKYASARAKELGIAIPE